MSDLRDIPGFEGLYAVTRDGRVRAHPRAWVTGADGNIRRTHRGMWMKLSFTTTGYLSVKLSGSESSVAGRKMVHRLVALAWIPNPFNHPQVNHLNGRKTDNKDTNLEWCTAAENARHAHRTGLVNLDTETFRASVRSNVKAAHAATRKLTYEQADDARRRFAAGERKTYIAKSLGIARATLRVLLKGETYVR